MRNKVFNFSWLESQFLLLQKYFIIFVNSNLVNQQFSRYQNKDSGEKHILKH